MKHPQSGSLALAAGDSEPGTLQQGLVLVTGPTGHGKFDHLAALISEINRTRPCHIITIKTPLSSCIPTNRP